MICLAVSHPEIMCWIHKQLMLPNTTEECIIVLQLVDSHH